MGKHIDHCSPREADRIEKEMARKVLKSRVRKALKEKAESREIKVFAEEHCDEN